ncbi:MAG: neutral/alkaline non-lysosomal ceramidase N-terminal domain-containing protein [Candidatus Omnitrophota bacterium]
MIRRRFLSLSLLFLLLLPFPALAALKAGAARTVITPQTSIWMAGYAFRNKPSEGKLHDLYARALALEDDQGTKAVFLASDIIGIPAGLAARVSARVEKECGVPRANLMLTCSHTHSGPALRDNLKDMYGMPEEEWQKVIQYMKWLEDKMVEVIQESVRDLKPAKISRGVGTASFTINRRQYNLDSISIGLNPIGPVDEDAPVLKVIDEKGAIKAVVFGYACHNTTLSGYEINGDYAGFAQLDLEEAIPGAVAMFFIGCGADQNPNPRRKIEDAQNHGRELAEAVRQVLSGAMKEVDGPIHAAFSLTDLSLIPAPTREQLQEQLKDSNIHIQRRAKNLLSTLDEKGKIPETYPYPLQVWRLNDFLIVAMGGEVVVDYSLRLKHELGRENAWIVGYANDVCCYIPSLRVLKEGGYESVDSMIYYGFHGPWAPPIEETIVKEVHRLVDAAK